MESGKKGGVAWSTYTKDNGWIKIRTRVRVSGMRLGGEAQNISEQQITQGEGDFSIVQVFFICGTQYLDPSRQDSGGDTIVLGGYCQRGS